MKKKSVVITKKSASFRLSGGCREMIKRLADENGISQAAVIELAVRAEMKKHERNSK